MAIPSINFPLTSPGESPLAALLQNAIGSYNSIQNLKSENIKNKYLEPNLQTALAQHAAELQAQQIKNQYLPQSLQAELALNQARLSGENINNKYLPQLLQARIAKLNNIAQGQQFAPLSNVGKLQQDYQNISTLYGENSPQALELKSAIGKQSSPANVQTRRAAEQAMQPYINSIYENLPDIKKYFGIKGKVKEFADNLRGAPDIAKLKQFESDLQLFKEEAARLVNLPADQEARKAFSKAFDFDTWKLNPDQAEKSLKKAIEKVREAGRASTIQGYEVKNNNQKMITGSDGRQYSIEELQKIAGGGQ
jgi:hypothetical protein